MARASQKLPSPPSNSPNVTKEVDAAAAPLTVHRAQLEAVECTPPTASDTLAPNYAAMEAENERALVCLTTFIHFQD